MEAFVIGNRTSLHMTRESPCKSQQTQKNESLRGRTVLWRFLIRVWYWDRINWYCRSSISPLVFAHSSESAITPIASCISVTGCVSIGTCPWYRMSK